VRPGRVGPEDFATVEAMTASLAHRGPDGSGLLERRRAVLGHRRLAVIDLSDRAGQPMLAAGTPDGADVAITYNGEVYDCPVLREALRGEGLRFLTRSDTEVVLQGWRAWGEGLPERLNGMFAFGVWDEAVRTLFLARDRYGQKPLYYAELPDGGLAFASELRAMRCVADLPGGVDRLALAKYLAFDAFPGEATALAGVKKLPPGCALTWREGRARVRRYHRREYGGCDLSPKAAAERLWELLREAVRRRLVSDVPLGVFLSGGIDSSAVLAAMASLVDPERIRTFAIGFQEASFDESGPARAVARHFGVDHSEEILGKGRLLELLPEVLDHLDEPLADASIVPTYALAKFARRHVTVALGGDGGDELFAGYDTFLADRIARPYLWVPGIVRRGVAGLVDLIPPSSARMSLQFRARRFVRGLDPDPLRRNQRWFGSFLPEEAAGLVRGAGSAEAVYEDLARLEPPPGEQAPARALTSTFLPDAVLTKVDRASMAVSLEVRAPLLDPDLAAFACSLPFRYKLRGLTRKWILRRALRGRLPSSILRRGKQGFQTPNGAWLRGPLREEVRALLDPQRLARSDLLEPAAVGRLVDAHLSGEQDLRKEVWALYVLERWLERAGLA